MNSVEHPNWLKIPEDIWFQIFGHLSHRKVFFLLPQLCSGATLLVRHYYIQFNIEEEKWKERCLNEKQASWGQEKEIEVLEKGSYPSWREVYLSSEPPYYILKKEKYDKKIKKYNEKLKEIEEKVTNIEETSNQSLFHQIITLFWLLIDSKTTPAEKNQEFIKYQMKINRIRKKEGKLCHRGNLEKMIVCIIGKKQFEKIPLFKECLETKGLIWLNDINYLKSLYVEDETFPDAVKGEIDYGFKFLFLHRKMKERVEGNKGCFEWNYHCFITTSQKIVSYKTKNHKYQGSPQFTLSGVERKNFNDYCALTPDNNLLGIQVSIIKQLQKLFSENSFSE